MDATRMSPLNSSRRPDFDDNTHDLAWEATSTDVREHSDIAHCPPHNRSIRLRYAPVALHV